MFSPDHNCNTSAQALLLNPGKLSVYRCGIGIQDAFDVNSTDSADHLLSDSVRSISCDSLAAICILIVNSPLDTLRM